MIAVKKIDHSNFNELNAGLANVINSWGGSNAPLSHLENLIADDRSYLFVAIVNDNVVGYALAYRFPSLYSADNLAYLYDIEVLPSQRKKGVGHKLIENILANLKADGVTELWLGTATDNTTAQAFLKATGAERSEERFFDYTYSL
jgi:ribosomal protein S18 acetylase RimI-like enzyme